MAAAVTVPGGAALGADRGNPSLASSDRSRRTAEKLGLQGEPAARFLQARADASAHRTLAKQDLRDALALLGKSGRASKNPVALKRDLDGVQAAVQSLVGNWVQDEIALKAGLGVEQRVRLAKPNLLDRLVSIPGMRQLAPALLSTLWADFLASSPELDGATRKTLGTIGSRHLSVATELAVEQSRLKLQVTKAAPANQAPLVANLDRNRAAMADTAGAQVDEIRRTFRDAQTAQIFIAVRDRLTVLQARFREYKVPPKSVRR